MENESIAEKLQGRFSHLLEHEGKKIGQYLLIFLALAVACIYFFFLKEEKKNPNSALETAFYALSHASSEELPSSLAAFEAALASNPSLAPNYQGRAAQLLLEKGSDQEALLLITPVFKRVAIESYPDFKSFSEITFQIEEGSLSQALLESMELQKRLDPATGLFAHNLVRIAFLQKILKDPGLQSTVAEMKSYLASSTSLKELQAIYAYKNLGLIQFFDTQDL